MNNTLPSMKTRTFLIFCAVGLVPIALGYGAKPSVTIGRPLRHQGRYDQPHSHHACGDGALPWNGRVLVVGCVQQMAGPALQLRSVHARTCRRTHTEFHPGRPAALAACRLCGPGDRARSDRDRTLQGRRFNLRRSVPMMNSFTVCGNGKDWARSRYGGYCHNYNISK